MLWWRRRKKTYREVNPEEIFLDSKNLPEFNTQQFEGRIETPIPKHSAILVGLFFVFILFGFTFKLGVLQIVKGDAYFQKSENNTLDRTPVFADRGIIYDRNQVKIAWNSWNSNEESDRLASSDRVYLSNSGFSHLVGYVSYPAKDSSGFYWQEYFVGKDGAEKIYDDLLKGTNGVRIIETDVKGNVQSENIVSPPEHGTDLTLSVDSRIQKALYDSLEKMSKNANFLGGGGVIMDVHSGEVLALASYPEYDSNILSKGKDRKIINGYITDKRKVFLNKIVAGLYTPGSIVKPFIGYAALEEGAISPLKNIFANGTISIPNPYFPDQSTIFRDHDIFGYVDMREAIAVSSDIYFYQIGGGYQDQRGIGISKIDEYAEIFGLQEKTGIDLLGEKTGIIPTPEWKAETFNGEPWRLGDTYNTSIGQYGFQVTPIQMVRSMAGIATGGIFPTPHIRFRDTEMEERKTVIEINSENMKVVHEGMRQAVTDGTAQTLNTSVVKIAAKSGTAQVGLGNTNTNSWIVGFFPYENPKYAFTILMERGPKEASGNATRVMREVIDFMSLNTPEYLD